MRFFRNILFGALGLLATGAAALFFWSSSRDQYSEEELATHLLDRCGNKADPNHRQAALFAVRDPQIGNMVRSEMAGEGIDPFRANWSDIDTRYAERLLPGKETIADVCTVRTDFAAVRTEMLKSLETAIQFLPILKRMTEVGPGKRIEDTYGGLTVSRYYNFARIAQEDVDLSEFRFSASEPKGLTLPRFSFDDRDLVENDLMKFYDILAVGLLGDVHHAGFRTADEVATYFAEHGQEIDQFLSELIEEERLGIFEETEIPFSISIRPFLEVNTDPNSPLRRLKLR